MTRIDRAYKNGKGAYYFAKFIFEELGSEDNIEVILIEDGYRIEVAVSELDNSDLAEIDGRAYKNKKSAYEFAKELLELDIDNIEVLAIEDGYRIEVK